MNSKMNERWSTLMKLKYLSCMILASLAMGAFSATAADNNSAIYFNTSQPVNDLQGSLAAEVKFAQSQILPAHPKEGDSQPHLTSQRKSLLLVRPVKADDKTPVQVEARDSNDKILGTLILSPPSALPDTVYHLDGVPAGGIDFIPHNETKKIINTVAEVKKLSDTSGSSIRSYLANNALVEIQTANGRWVRDIYLPQGAGLEGKMVRFVSYADYNSTVFYGDRKVTLSKGNTLLFKYVNGQWFRSGELENNRIAYAQHTWSTELPAHWIVPGLNLVIKQGNLSGRLNDIKVGAPGELLLHTIDIGMLTTPRDRFDFAKDKEAHREYFQTIPVSRMIVNNYAPLYLKEVMLPTGTLLTDADPGEGGWHNGTMRQHIGKELISHGIDNANYGINSTAGSGEGSHPYVAAQLAAHTSRGNYANGVQVHGGSGGGGIVTLDSTLGNEFSHEVGHNFGLGHYVDGFRGSVHRSADQINSTWGWDSDKQRFMPNFYPVQTNKKSCLDEQCQEPFDGHQFGFDAMAGGRPFSDANRFTMYTPNSSAIIQRFFENKAVFDSSSSTGFSKWNADTQKMEPYEHTIDRTEQITASVSDLSESKMAELMAEYSVVKVHMQDGKWTKEIHVPAASAENKGRILTLNHEATYKSYLFINGGEKIISRGDKKSFVSDGQTWKESDVVDTREARKPEQFGVPVTTLVGYYDPKGTLSSYIYPAMYGAYGFTYSDDSKNLSGNDCQLQVDTKEGQLRFKLANHRMNSSVMNKFHINVLTESQPTQASLVCNNKVLDTQTLTPAPEGLTYTVNGRALPAKEYEGCIVSVKTGQRYCLPVGQRSGYSLPDWIVGQEVYVDSGAKAKVLLSDWDNLSYNRIGEFVGNVYPNDMKKVKAWNGQYLDFSRPRSMRVVYK
ncbi:M66 family glycomucinase StcE [Escherichia coli]|uniref:M66 family glycomucinase StcE n=1 Tax=Escherichia coli TaxID=562 RepID=UPI0015C566D8|nr:M66 family glycomucinase StcE [Escherichia coli]HEI0341381.1 peptidase M66 [Escherichia coli]HEI0389842.1 peptidase M66 [Escherichia coli]